MKDINLEEVFIYLMERTQQQMKRYAQKALKEGGVEITSEQWVVLKRISEQEQLNQRELADLTFRDPASVTRTLDLLEKKGLVERADTAGDRRAYHLVLTEAGAELVKKITPIAQAVRAIGLKDVDEAELKQFKATLNKIYQNYS